MNTENPLIGRLVRVKHKGIFDRYSEEIFQVLRAHYIKPSPDGMCLLQSLSDPNYRTFIHSMNLEPLTPLEELAHGT